MECNTWTIRGPHKSGQHAHRAITHDWGKPEGGELWFAHLRKPRRGQACSQVLMVARSGSMPGSRLRCWWFHDVRHNTSPFRLNTQEVKVAKQQRDRDPFKYRDCVKDTREHIYRSGEGNHDEELARVSGMIPQSGHGKSERCPQQDIQADSPSRGCPSTSCRR